MRRSSLKPGAVYFDTGPLPIYFGLCRSEKNWLLEVKRLEIKDPPTFLVPGKPGVTHTFTGRETNRKMTCSIVCIDPAWKPHLRSEFFGLLVHEATHVWQRAQDAMNGGHQGDEIEAYTIQWFAQSLYYEFDRGACQAPA